MKVWTTKKKHPVTQPKEDRFLRNNSAEKYCREITKIGKDAARWDRNLSRQNFFSTMNSSRVILKKLKKKPKIADLVSFLELYFGPRRYPRHAVCGSKLEI